MRPVIAVMPLVDDERESLWMLSGYMDALREAGAVPFMPALTADADEIRQIFAMCDGLFRSLVAACMPWTSMAVSQAASVVQVHTASMEPMTDDDECIGCA